MLTNAFYRSVFGTVNWEAGCDIHNGSANCSDASTYVGAISSYPPKIGFSTQSIGLDSLDYDATQDALVKDGPGGHITLASYYGNPSAGGYKSDATSFLTALTSDGSKAVFQSAATNMGSSNMGSSEGTIQVYIRDLSTLLTTLVSKKADGTI